MAEILVHAAAATAGGGKTYLGHFLRQIAAGGERHRWHVLTPPGFEPEGAVRRPHVRYESATGAGGARRVVDDQWRLRREVRRRGIDLIVATGNFGLIRPPAPQVLLNRNPLYFSTEHLANLTRRGEMKELANILVRRRLAIASIQSSVRNVTPTAAFAEAIADSVPGVDTGSFRVIPHGFDAGRFVQPDARLSPAIADRLKPGTGVKRLLMVSHYNHFRNFETMLRGFAALRTLHGGPVELVLTTKLGEGVRDHRYDTTATYRLMRRLGVARDVTMLGTVPYEDLYPLYRACHACVCPSYAETFGHPMVEAMAAERPVVASDRPVQREMCQDAAFYFDVFDGDHCGRQMLAALTDADAAAAKVAAGRRRAAEFSWNDHFADLAATIDEVLAERAALVTSA